MPLSNAQYDEIMHEYDERQLHNRHILETRRAEVLKKLPRLKEIDASVASSSVRQARLHLDGDTHALASLKQELWKFLEIYFFVICNNMCIQFPVFQIF